MSPNARHGDSSKVAKRLVNHLQSLRNELSEEEIILLESLFKSPFFKTILKIGRCIDIARQNPLIPVSTRACETFEDVVVCLSEADKNDDAQQELLRLLSKWHFESLLKCHDVIANEGFLSKQSLSGDFNEEITRIIIYKEYDEQLGVTIKKHMFSGSVIVARILHGMAAQREGSLGIGDEVLSINGTYIEDMTLDNVVQLMSLKCKTLTLEVIKDTEVPQHLDGTDEKMYVRALFDYDPISDSYLTCKEAGCGFSKGDILEILDRTDNRWWQARRVNQKTIKVGLIPSRTFQEMRLANTRGRRTSLLLKDAEEKDKQTLEPLTSPGGSPGADVSHDFPSLSGSLDISALSINDHDAKKKSKEKEKKKKKKKKKIKFEIMKTEEYKLDDIAAYQEVTHVMPDPKQPRPIFLLGTSGIGCDRIANKIIEYDSDTFQNPQLNTSRHKMHHEISTKDLKFMSRSEFEKERKKDRMINVKRLNGYSVGVSVESVQEIQLAGKICITEIQPKDLRNKYVIEICPMVIFVKSPTLEKLLTTRKSFALDDSGEESPMTEKDAMDTVIASEGIELACGRYIDLRIVNDDEETTINQLYHIVNKRKNTPQWIMVQKGSF